jgi:hypothetical protein
MSNEISRRGVWIRGIVWDTYVTQGAGTVAIGYMPGGAPVVVQRKVWRAGCKGERVTRTSCVASWRVSGPLTRAQADQGEPCLFASVEAATMTKAMRQASDILTPNTL